MGLSFGCAQPVDTSESEEPKTTETDQSKKTAEPAKKPDIIKIGYIGALTGDVASLGQDEKKSIELFLANNSLIGGHTVEMIYEDGQCNPEKASSAAQKLTTVDKVQVILGGLCSGETLNAAEAANQNKVILFSSISTSPKVTTAGDYVFRNAPSDETSTDVMSDILKKKFKKAALISQNNDFAQAYRNALITKLKAKGVEVSLDETFNTGTTDFKTILQKVKDAKADVLVNLSGESSPSGFITRQAKELGVNLPIYGTDVLSGKEYFDIAKDAAEGSIIVITAANKTRPEVQKLLDEFKQKFGSNPVAEAYTLLSYDRMNIIKNAIEAVGYNGEKIKEYLYKMPEYDGLGGKTKFDQNGDSSILPSVMIAKNGKYELYQE